MMDIQVTNNLILIESAVDETPVAVSVFGQPLVIGSVAGQQGPAGDPPSPGPGFKLVGAELRYDFASLTRG